MGPSCESITGFWCPSTCYLDGEKELDMDGTPASPRQPDRRDHVSRAQLLARIRAEFEELPSLRLTRGQAQRLFGLRPDICERVLAALVSDGSLCCDHEGRYRKHDDDAWRRSMRAS
jgi:hypothetical protein